MMKISDPVWLKQWPSGISERRVMLYQIALEGLVGEIITPDLDGQSSPAAL
jgi:hypothetical protein